MLRRLCILMKRNDAYSSKEERAMNLFELIQIFLMVLVLVVLSYID